MVLCFISAAFQAEYRIFVIRLLLGFVALELLLYGLNTLCFPSPLQLSSDSLIHRRIGAPFNLASMVTCPVKPPETIGFLVIKLPKKLIGTKDITSKYSATIHAYSRDLVVFDETSNFQWPFLINRHEGGLFDGGHFIPTICKARQKVALIIPYRDRDMHLRIFINHMIPILKRQQRDFKIYVVEQVGKDDKFNRGALLNVGFVEALRDYDWQCVIFHDVDLLPESDENIYECIDEQQPIHFGGHLDKFNYTLPYSGHFGGIEGFPVETFRSINGFSNLYWGWGGEDDDLFQRVVMRGYNVIRPSPRTARYKMIKHKQNIDTAIDRFNLLKFTKRNAKFDGLSTLKYTLEQVRIIPLYTHLIATIHQRDYKYKL